MTMPHLTGDDKQREVIHATVTGDGLVMHNTSHDQSPVLEPPSSLLYFNFQCKILPYTRFLKIKLITFTYLRTYIKYELISVTKAVTVRLLNNKIIVFMLNIVVLYQCYNLQFRKHMQTGDVPFFAF